MTEPTHLTSIELAGFVDDRLDRETRRAVASHLDACALCREELIAVSRLVEAGHAAGPGVAPRRRIAWALTALAATLAAIALVREVPRREPETVRAPGLEPSIASRVTAVSPRDGASLAGPDRGFTWRSHGADNYRFVFLAEDGTPLLTVYTHDTALTLPESVPLIPGRNYFWRVDALVDGITASTGTMRLQAVR